MAFIDSLVEEAENAPYPWENKGTKEVPDPMDGFITEYSLWQNQETKEWVCIFGDTDLYNPNNSEPDVSFEQNEEEARSWFENYTTEDEAEEKEILSSKPNGVQKPSGDGFPPM